MKKVDDPDDGSASVSSGGTHPSETGTFKCISSVDLSSQSSGSQKLSSRSSGSSSSSSSSVQSRDFTKEMYSQLMESSDKWASEDDVILDMKTLSVRN